MPRCEHGLKSTECYVCASPKVGKYRTLDDDIIKMAREAWGEDHEIFWFDDNGIERFEALVRADEREACAKRLEAIGCDHCAANIRARSKE